MALRETDENKAPRSGRDKARALDESKFFINILFIFKSGSTGVISLAKHSQHARPGYDSLSEPVARSCETPKLLIAYIIPVKHDYGI